jgi:predicted permease
VSDVFNALAPVFLLIALGWGARAARILPDEAWGAVNRFGYFLPYPAFLFTTVAGADLHANNAGPFLAACLSGFGAMVAIALAIRPLFKNAPAYTSVFQGVVRWNGFVILAAANSLYGPRGEELIALAFGPLVLLINLICVAVLARWGAQRIVSKRALVAQVLGNPLVLGCAAGLLFNAMGLSRLGPASDALALIGQSAMPLALVCVGAGIEFGPLRRGFASIGLACALKLIIAPMALFATAHLFRLDPVAAAVCAAIGSTSTAAASYTLAREMGGDARLMAGIVSATTLVSFLTMPIAIALTSP